MKNLLLFIGIFITLHLCAQKPLHIVPMPAEVKMGKGITLIDRQTIIFYNSVNLKNLAEQFSNQLQETHQLKLSAKFVEKGGIAKQSDNCILLSLNTGKASPTFPSNYYTLAVQQHITEITAMDEAGIFYGIQTFLQLLPISNQINRSPIHPIRITQLFIKDYPRFSYRGMHLDVARHFMPVPFLKKYIDYLAMYKFNRFHWHLTDDQGWRIEIKKYPQLTAVGAWRNGTITGRYPGNGNDGIKYGGYYTQEEIKELIKYAADRFISIIPEIEMPGHASAAIAAYPQLSCFPEEDTEHPAESAWNGSTKGKQVQQTWGVFEDVFCPGEFTFNFLQDVLDEVMDLFPSEYIHIGGDECPKESWKRSAFCKQLMKEKGLKNEHELQSYFIQRIEKYVNSKGKKIIGWDEILEGGLAPNATVMSWRGEEGGIVAAQQNHDVVMTPGDWCYFDHSQSKNEDSVTIGGYLPLENVYGYDPIPAALPAEKVKHILGAQGNVWTEYIKTPGKVEYMIFPRLAALSEVLWTPKEKKNWKDFERRLPDLFKRYSKMGIRYSEAYYDLNSTILPTERYDGLLWKIDSKINDVKICISDKKVPGETTISKNPAQIKITGGGICTAAICQDGHLSTSLQQQFYFNKVTGKKITLTTPPSPAYPGDGAFTLVNGIQNEKGTARTDEFIGFEGKDCEAMIDLGKYEIVSNIILHSFSMQSDWIWPPSSFEVYSSTDGVNFSLLGSTNTFIQQKNQNGIMTIKCSPSNTRYVKVLIKNHGVIPEGKPGAGNNAWLFLDEIEIN